MIGVFVDQDHRQQARPGEAARDRMEWSRRLADLLAGPAAELLAHVLGHEPLPRHHVERLGDVLADLRELAAAAARAARRRGMHDAPARQMRRESCRRVAWRRVKPCTWTARRLAPSASSSPAAAASLLELQFQLIEQPLAALRARTELSRFIFAITQLQLLDQRLGAWTSLRARLDQRSPSARRRRREDESVRSRSCTRHAITIALICAPLESTSQIHNAAFSPPPCGRHVCCGIAPVDPFQH